MQTLILAIVTLAPPPGVTDPPEIRTGIDLTESVVPFLKQHCYACHSDSDPAGDRDLTKLAPAISSAAAADGWLRVLDQLQIGLMPPLGEEQPAAATRARVTQQLEAALLESGHAEAHRRKLRLPSYGNYVDHDALFSGTIKTKPYSPARLWRTSPYIFDAKRRVGKIRGIQNPYGFSTPDSSLRDYAATSEVGGSVVETIMLNANAEIDYLFRQADAVIANPPKKRSRPNPLVPFLVDRAEPTHDEMSALIVGTFTRLTARPPSAKEVDKYVDFLRKNIRDTADMRRSVKATLTAIYLSPEAIYRMEWGLGEVDELGRRMLSPEELAYALSYALFDHGPRDGGRSENQKLVGRALDEGRLRTRADVAQVVTEILRDEQYKPIGGKAKNNVPRVTRFFREFFGYHRAVDVFKDARRVNEHGLYHNPRHLVADADNLIKVILREDKHVFERMLTTSEALVFHDGDNLKLVERHESLIAELRAYNEESVRKDIERRKAGLLKKPKYKANPKLVPPALKRIENEGRNLLAQKKAQLARLLKNGVSLKPVKSRDYRYIRAYNLDTRNWKWPAEQPFKLPRQERAGILTHPAWLVAHSVNDGNDPVHRGIWVYEKLLAGVIGDVPPSVDARIPEDPHSTLRQRMQFLRADACWKCHHRINPLGEAFEMFDDFGRFRSKHYFNEQGHLTTESAEHVRSEDGREVVRPIDRDRLVTEGRYSTKPVNASGSFNELGIPGLQGDFSDAVEMVNRIAKTDRARQSIIRHLFRYLMGRNEMLSDSQTLIDADRAYVESEGSFKAVIVSLLSSDSFLYRR